MSSRPETPGLAFDTGQFACWSVKARFEAFIYLTESTLAPGSIHTLEGTREFYRSVGLHLCHCALKGI